MWWKNKRGYSSNGNANLSSLRLAQTAQEGLGFGINAKAWCHLPLTIHSLTSLPTLPCQEQWWQARRRLLWSLLGGVLFPSMRSKTKDHSDYSWVSQLQSSNQGSSVSGWIAAAALCQCQATSGTMRVEQMMLENNLRSAHCCPPSPEIPTPSHSWDLCSLVLLAVPKSGCTKQVTEG